jgi:uncharacterized protein YutE (UPF0331/DUF86 family)
MTHFNRISESLTNNIAEVRSAIKDPYLLENIDGQKFERTVYLFQSITKSLVDIGNHIIIENDFRSPLNTADVFISLAEHDVITSSIVPGVKKAAIAMPKIRELEDAELSSIMTDCIDDISRCLVSFKKYHDLKASGD